MYYNKNLFVNEQIRLQVKKLQKTQFLVAACIAVGICAVIIPVAILFKYLSDHNLAFSFIYPIAFIVLYATSLSVFSPLTKRYYKLCAAQTEDIKETSLHEKYSILLNAGVHCFRLHNYILMFGISLGLILSLILAIVFPYDAWYPYLAFIGITYIAILIALIATRRRRKKINSLEKEISLCLLLQKAESKNELTEQPQQ